MGYRRRFKQLKKTKLKINIELWKLVKMLIKVFKDTLQKNLCQMANRWQNGKNSSCK